MYWVRCATHPCICHFFFSPSAGAAAFIVFLAAFAPSVDLAGALEAVLLSPPQIPAGLKGFLRIPQDYTIISVTLSWMRKFLSSPQESSGLGQSLAEFLLH